MSGIFLGDALGFYAEWPAPTVIVSDGAYGLGSFPGEPRGVSNLPEWYGPHIQAWGKHALPETTLWFWNTELGWATTHPILDQSGWDYKAVHVWDKGPASIAGRVNSNTTKKFPGTTEVCVQYVRRVRLPAGGGEKVTIKEWLRREWVRTGLPLSKADEACGVARAATRKYLTQGWQWYAPPPEVMERLAAYANQHGVPTDVPYYSVDGKTPTNAAIWSQMSAKWNHIHGVSNVWDEPPVRGAERVKGRDGECLHPNQKPLRLLDRIVRSSSDPGDVVWEPFGGLCSTAVAARRLGRLFYSAETNQRFYTLAKQRIDSEAHTLFGEDLLMAAD